MPTIAQHAIADYISLALSAQDVVAGYFPGKQERTAALVGSLRGKRGVHVRE